MRVIFPKPRYKPAYHAEVFTVGSVLPPLVKGVQILV
jgi:hypothetical protein